MKVLNIYYNDIKISYQLTEVMEVKLEDIIININKNQALINDYVLIYNFNTLYNFNDFKVIFLNRFEYLKIIKPNNLSINNKNATLRLKHYQGIIEIKQNIIYSRSSPFLNNKRINKIVPFNNEDILDLNGIEIINKDQYYLINKSIYNNDTLSIYEQSITSLKVDNLKTYKLKLEVPVYEKVKLKELLLTPIIVLISSLLINVLSKNSSYFLFALLSSCSTIIITLINYFSKRSHNVKNYHKQINKYYLDNLLYYNNNRLVITKYQNQLNDEYLKPNEIIQKLTNNQNAYYNNDYLKLGSYKEKSFSAEPNCDYRLKKRLEKPLTFNAKFNPLKDNLIIKGNEQYKLYHLTILINQIIYYFSKHQLKLCFVYKDSFFDMFSKLEHTNDNLLLMAKPSNQDQVFDYLLNAKDNYLLIIDDFDKLIKHQLYNKIQTKNSNIHYLSLNKQLSNGKEILYHSLDYALFEDKLLKIDYLDTSKINSLLYLPNSINNLLNNDLRIYTQNEISDNYQMNYNNKLEVSIGICDNKLVTLDLSEHGNGPHGLIAGTTGSGKSYLLQSYLISLAYRYHPSYLNFIFIDYKGGSLAQQFQDLKHVVGIITNLDEARLNNSLEYIKNEVVKRQQLFKNKQVNHIDDYPEAMSHLLIVCDEFAQLKKDNPEFISALVSIARLGRSLGIHLILATQKPSGIIDDQINANLSFKICLKMNDELDSREILGNSDACLIKRPGGAYLKTSSIYTKIECPTILVNEDVKLVNEYEFNNINKVNYFNIIKDKIINNTKDVKVRKIINEALPSYYNKEDKNNNIIGVYEDINNLKHQAIYYQNQHLILYTQQANIDIIKSIIGQQTNLYSPKQFQFYLIDLANQLNELKKYKHCLMSLKSNEDDQLPQLLYSLQERLKNKQSINTTLIINKYDLIHEFKQAEQLEEIIIKILKIGLLNNINIILINNDTHIRVSIVNLFKNKLVYKMNTQSELNNVLNSFQYSNNINNNQLYYLDDDINLITTNTIKLNYQNINNKYQDDYQYLPLIPYEINEVTLLSKDKDKLKVGYNYLDASEVYLDFNKSILIKADNIIPIKKIIINHLIKHKIIYQENNYLLVDDNITYYLIDDLDSINQIKNNKIYIIMINHNQVFKLNSLKLNNIEQLITDQNNTITPLSKGSYYYQNNEQSIRFKTI